MADFGQRALAYLIDTALTLIGLVPVIIGIIVLAVGASNSVTTTTDDFGTPSRATTSTRRSPPWAACSSRSAR